MALDRGATCEASTDAPPATKPRSSPWSPGTLRPPSC